MSDEAPRGDASSRRISVSLKNLYLDPNNYRIIHEIDQVNVPDEKIKDSTVSRRTFGLLSGDRNQNIQDLIDSFCANGYLPVDQIQVRELSGGGYVVVEGNRRVAALKHLAAEYDQKGIELEKLDPSIFTKIPVVIYADADEIHHLTLMALKHISGNKKWGEWNQAKLLEKMHKVFHVGEDEICRRIGISKVELRRSLRALSLVEQYCNSDYGDQFNENKFPIFREAVRNPSLKEWMGWDDDQYTARNAQNRDMFFALLSREPLEEEDTDGHVGFGDRFLDPAINKRDDIKLLGEIIGDRKALEQLKASRNLNTAYRASDLIFRGRQEIAIKSVASDINTLSQLAIRGEHLPELESAFGMLQSIIDRTKSSGLFGAEQRGVFHDRIDHHFTKLEIIAYKKFNNFKISEISKINLFAGINNIGKTTLLEAFYLLARQNDFNGLLEVMRRRGKVSADHLDPEWMLEQLTDDIKISGQFDGQETSISVRHYQESDPLIDKSRYLQSVELTAQFGAKNQESLTRIYIGRERETQADSIRLLCPVVYSSPFFLNEPKRYAGFYHKSVQSKSLQEILEFLRSNVISTLGDIRLIDDRQRFLVDDSAFPQSVDLSSYGEGLQRMFFMSLIFASAQNGIVLIDEFENAIHTELIGQFARFVHQLAVTFNVQVFLTSHSKECIDAFVHGIPPENLDNCTFHALVDQDKRVGLRSFIGQEFRKLILAGNVDLRRAR